MRSIACRGALNPPSNEVVGEDSARTAELGEAAAKTVPGGMSMPFATPMKSTRGL